MSHKLKDNKQNLKRRGNNEGSIYKRKSDDLWVGSVTIGYKNNGKPLRKTIYGKTRQEVARKVSALASEVFGNGYTTILDTTEHNFKILCDEWFDLYVSPNIASVTEANRRNLLKNHIYLAFGDLDVEAVNTVKLQKFFNEKVKSGLCADTIIKMKNLLINFFKYLVKKNIVKENPAIEVLIKKNFNNLTNTEKQALRPEIREWVFTKLAENEILSPIVTTFSLTGLRPQELIALKWENVSLKNKTIFVRNAVNRVYEFDDDGNVISRDEVIGKTKTPKSVRKFIIPNSVVETLNQWREYCENNNIVSDFVFPNTKTGNMRTYSGLRSLLVRFIEKYNLQEEEITLYTFRHTFATLLLEKRENPKIVASLMGHKKVSTTLDIYSHVFSNEVYAQTADTLDAVYANYKSTIPQQENSYQGIV